MQQQVINESTLWRYSDLAKYLRVSEHKLRRDVMNRTIPFIKCGRSVRFNPEKIKQWLDANTTEVLQ